MVIFYLSFVSDSVLFHPQIIIIDPNIWSNVSSTLIMMYFILDFKASISKHFKYLRKYTIIGFNEETMSQRDTTAINHSDVAQYLQHLPKI